MAFEIPQCKDAAPRIVRLSQQPRDAGPPSGGFGRATALSSAFPGPILAMRCGDPLRREAQGEYLEWGDDDGA